MSHKLADKTDEDLIETMAGYREYSTQWILAKRELERRDLARAVTRYDRVIAWFKDHPFWAWVGVFVLVASWVLGVVVNVLTLIGVGK